MGLYSFGAYEHLNFGFTAELLFMVLRPDDVVASSVAVSWVWNVSYLITLFSMQEAMLVLEAEVPRHKGGLMLRPHVGFKYDFSWSRLGLNYTYVDFPNGNISSDAPFSLDIPFSSPILNWKDDGLTVADYFELIGVREPPPIAPGCSRSSLFTG